MDARLFDFDWSGTISDDRKPVYTANMRLLQEHGKPTMTFEEWLPRTRMTPGEFLADHGVYGDQDELFRAYTRYFEEAKMSGVVPVPYADAEATLRYLRERDKEIV
ncbi:MAG: HAD hydrolase-like protein, partial [Candidatus Aenigmarchaeota archaeon]|nr:HAD hydrolase-like protein [Candidatus Aenigmarchaeota archaeon]